MMDWAGILTAVAILLTALSTQRSSSSESASHLTEAAERLVELQAKELELARAGSGERDEILRELVPGACNLIDQICELGVEPVFVIPSEWIRRWSNGHGEN